MVSRLALLTMSVSVKLVRMGQERADEDVVGHAGEKAAYRKPEAAVDISGFDKKGRIKATADGREERLEHRLVDAPAFRHNQHS